MKNKKKVFGVLFSDDCFTLLDAMSLRLRKSPDEVLESLLLQAASLVFTKNELKLLFGKQIVIDTMYWEES